MATIEDNAIFGEKYYTSGRYDYTAIDRTHANGTGTADCLSGIKPKKLAVSICHAINRAQYNALEYMIAAIHFGETGNSEAIFMFATNDGDTYKDYFKAAIIKLRDILATGTYDANAWLSLVRTLECAFWAASESYRREFQEETKFQNFTHLDIAVCVHFWIEKYKAEFEANGLAGY